MDDNQRNTLRRQLSGEEVTHRYQQAISYFVEGARTGIVDITEYKIFQETLVKRDLSAAAHAWFGMAITWEEYFDLVQAIIGFDLMVQGAISGQIKAKSNGEDTEKEIDTNEDLLSLEKEE